MRGVPLLSLFICFLSAVYGQKLSEAENLERYQSCGKYSNETAKEVPWVIDTLHPYNSWSGFAISSRHTVTFSKAAMYMNNDGQVKWRERDPVDWNTCKDGVMPVPDDTIEIFSTKPCGAKHTCEHENKVTKGVFIGKCDGTIEPFGLIVLEMEPDYLKNESAIPVCLDENVVANTGDKVELYYYFSDADSIERVENTVEDCGDRERSDVSVCVKNGPSYKLSGGAFVKNVGGRMTAVAVAHNYDSDSKAVLPHVSINKYLPQICKVTGVCQPPPPPTTTQPPSPPITDKITEEKDQESEEQSNEDTGTENGSAGTEIFLLSGVLALFVYLY